MSKTPERLAYEAWYRKQFDSTMYCESTWRGWEAGRAALTQAADAGAALVDKSPDLQGSLVDKTANLQGQAGAAEPVAAIADLQAKIDVLEEELSEAKQELDDALRAPWPEWAEQMKKTIRKYSGYDGFDDASEGIDLPAELDELMEHAIEPSAQLQQAVAREREDAERYRWLKKTRFVTLMTMFFGNGCINKTVEMAEAEIDKERAAAIRQQGTP